MRSLVVSGLVAGVLVSAVAPAQAVIQIGRLDLGFRAGANVSNVSNNVTGLTDTADGLYLGAIAGLGVTNLLGVETGVVYASKGGQGLGGETNLDYVSVPLRGRVPLSNAAVQPYFLVGMEFSFLTRAERTEPRGTTDVKDDFNTFDFGLGAGVGVEVPIRKVLAVFEYTWMRGLTDVSKVEGLEGRNRTSQFVAGLKYRFASPLF